MIQHLCTYIPGPAEATCSVASNSRVTGFPGSTELTTETVENTVEETEDCRDEAKRVKCSILVVAGVAPVQVHRTGPKVEFEYVDVDDDVNSWRETTC